MKIRKNRYYLERDGKKFTIDMFLGDLFGLVMAEVSFDTDEELDPFPCRRLRLPTSLISSVSAAANFVN